VRAGTRDVTSIDSQRGYPAMLGTLILNGPESTPSQSFVAAALLQEGQPQ
jgi:hypothetical protein